MTSKSAGRLTSCMAALSTSMCSSSTPGWRGGRAGDLLAPQARGLEHVRLVDRGHLAPAPGGGAEAPLGQPLDLGQRVDAGVEGAVGLASALAEVDAAGQLAHHQQVGALDALAPQRAGVVERRPGAHRPQVGVEAEARAQPQQPLLRARLGGVGRVPPRAARRRPSRTASEPAQASSTSSVRAVPWASIDAPPTRCSCQATARPWSGATASTVSRATATTSGPIPSPGSSATDTSVTRGPGRLRRTGS